MNGVHAAISVAAVTVLLGCSAAVEQKAEEPLPEAPPRKAASQVPAAAPYAGERELATGIRNYEDGKYGPALASLQASLNLGLSNRDVVRAHKYLAFIHCASEHAAKCQAHFRMALTVDPSFELDPAEAGHPIWGPAFRSVKSQR